jgi:hypothetical protein
MIVLVLLFALVFLLAADGQKIVSNVELDVLLPQTGEFGGNLDRLVSVSLISMRGTAELAKPGTLRVTPSTSRSISCCRNENGLVSQLITARWVPTGITDFVLMCTSLVKPYWHMST